MELTRVTLTQEEIAWIIEVRRHRSKVFGEHLFFDPAWDILLELLAARLASRRTTLDDLSAIAPRSTLARWVAALGERELVRCEVDPLEPNQLRLELSSEGAERMMCFLSAAWPPRSS